MHEDASVQLGTDEAAWHPANDWVGGSAPGKHTDARWWALSPVTPLPSQYLSWPAALGL